MTKNISLRKLEADGAKQARAKHGVYAYLSTGQLPSGRAWKRIQVEIAQLRQALIEQYGGDRIQPTVLTLIESAIEGLTIQRLATLYVKKAGIMRRDSLRRGDLQLHSVLSGQFISYANLVRLNLESASRLASMKSPMDNVVPADVILNTPIESEDEPESAQDEPATMATVAPEAPETPTQAVPAGQTAAAEAKDLACSEKAANGDSYKPVPAPPTPKPRLKPVNVPRHSDLDHLPEFCSIRGCGAKLTIELEEELPDGRINLSCRCTSCGRFVEGFALSAAGAAAWREIQRIQGED